MSVCSRCTSGYSVLASTSCDPSSVRATSSPSRSSEVRKRLDDRRRHRRSGALLGVEHAADVGGVRRAARARCFALRCLRYMTRPQAVTERTVR